MSTHATINRVRARFLAPVAALGAVLVLAPAPAAHAGPADPTAPDASGTVVVSQVDPLGDVKILKPGPRIKRSIDLANLVVTNEAEDGVRFTVTLKRIVPTTKYRQTIEIQMKPGDRSETWFDDITMSPQDPDEASASYSTSIDSLPNSCQLAAEVTADTGTVSLLVPPGCLPTSAAKIRVYASFEGIKPATSYALDKIRVKGAQTLQ